MSAQSNRLKELREKLELTQEELGKILGLKWSQIKDMESGKVEISFQIAKLICHKTGVNSTWFLCGESKMFEDDTTRLGKRIRYIREVWGYIQRDFARAIGIDSDSAWESASIVDSFETGIKEPNLKILLKTAMVEAIEEHRELFP